MKLHLGCGGTYLEGYVNIDYPTDDNTIMKVRADVYTDIKSLNYEPGTIDEVRSHHLFEHFNRAEALALIIRWRRWLKPGGRLVIETPDHFWCSLLTALVPNYKYKMRLGRHMFGSQEAPWAEHLDFWYRAKFKRVLKSLGFDKLKFFHPVYRHLLPNIKVTAEKSKINLDEPRIVREILSDYLIKGEDKDKFMSYWLKDYHNI